MRARATWLGLARAGLLAVFVIAGAGVVWARSSPNHEVRYRGKRVFRVRRLQRPVRALLLLAVVQVLLWPALRRRTWPILAGFNRVCANRRVIWLAAGVLVAAFVWSKVNQHRAFDTHAGDLSIFDTAISNCLRGDPFYSPLLNRHYFSQHYVPFFYALVPVYALWDSPYVLLVIQGAAVAMAVVPLYLLIARRFPEPYVPAVLAFSWITCRDMSNGLFFDFHPEMLSPVCLFTAFVLLDRILAREGRAAASYAGFFACVLLAATLKEDVLIYVFGIAVYVAIFARRWRFGMALGVVCVIGAYLAAKVAIDHYGANAGGGLRFLDRYAKYGETNGEIAVSVLTKPWLVLGDLAKSGFPRLLGVTLFLPLLAPLRLAVLGVLPVLPCAISNWESQARLSHYWGVPALPYLIYVALIGLDRLCRKYPQRRARILAAACVLVAIANFGHHELHRVQDRHQVGDSIAKSIPARASLAAQYDLMPHVARRARGYTRKLYVLKQTAQQLPVDYAFFDTQGNVFPLGSPDLPSYETVLKSFEHNPEYDCVVDRAGYKLFRRNPPHEQRQGS